LIDLHYEFVTENVFSARFFLSLFLREEKRPDPLFGRILDRHRLYQQISGDVIARGQECGTLSREVDPGLHAGLVLSALNGVLVQGFMGEPEPEPEPQPPQRLVEQLKTTLVDRLQVQ